MMHTQRINIETLKKIKQIELRTKRLLSGMYIGENRSPKRGSGFDFDQIREYQFGDDLRFIDWKASARMDTLLIKEYIEERSRAVLLAVDFSGSSFFTSTKQLKYDAAAQVASTLALIANYSNDYVGLILFSDDIELYIPPRQGKMHVRTVMEQIFNCEPKKTGTCFESVFKQIAKIKRKDTVVFLISDFIGDIQSRYLPIIAKMYDVIAIRCLDKNEKKLPMVGFVTVEDIETGDTIMLDARSRGVNSMKSFLAARITQQNDVFKRCGVEVIDVLIGRPFIDDIILFFAKRMRS